MKARTVEGGGVSILCPGCNERHVADSRWSFNGDKERPTLSPSLHIRKGHHVTGQSADSCGICNAAKEDGNPTLCGVCHSFVRDGRIQYLSDCTHHLAGQTVDLPEVGAEEL